MSNKMEYESDGEEHEEIEDLSDPFVVTCYQSAGQIAQKALKEVIALCVDGKSIVEICTFGDALIETECSKTFTKHKGLIKGIGFPTCISVNSCIGHFSPLKGDTRTLKNGDVVKIDLGAHINGYVAVAAHTVIVGQTGTAPTQGKVADAVCAAHYAMESALRLIRPGNKTSQVTEAITKCAEFYQVTPAQGILSHELKRFSMDGEKVIFSKVEAGQKTQVFEFLENEVYCVDIVMSTGDGKSKEQEDRTTVYKRVVDNQYQLKIKSSKDFLTEVDKRFTAFPFTIRSFADVTKAKLGLSECIQHNLITQFPVFYDRPGSIVVQFKTTVLCLPSGNQKVVGQDLQLPFVKSEFSITDPKIIEFLNTPLRAPKKTTATKTATAKMDTN